ncbi:ABC transporter permease [Parasphingorhabdus sp.]|uniref:ABC transporter permease n=1 Tax=Parasphingorhabdus sp. TaxID=2709688 RepID=UPI002B27BC23|nr:ABC transporter permease [Parasphingorhabdus sp.]|tara:strand:+ start:606 stop:1808 length:1203 start_codon:yes stop_codon:yes gene_type:complete
MISLAGRDILHGWGKFVLTGVGLGLLIGVTLSMAGVYRGMVSDAQALLDNSRADLWVVQKDTLGPYAEPSSLPEDSERPIRAMRGVSQAAGVTYLTMQIAHDGDDVRVMVVGTEMAVPGEPGQPTHLLAGRHIVRGHYEAVADVKSGFAIGDKVKVRRNYFQIVGLTSRMVSSGGDPMLFLSLKDAQQAQFQKDSDAIQQQRARTESSPLLNPPGNSAVATAVNAAQTGNGNVNAVLVTVKPGADPDKVAAAIRRWQRLTVYTRAQMEEILVEKLIANSARQIAMFLVILSIVSAAIVAFIIYTMTIGKIREIAVLKLIGTRNRTISWMILQQALGLGLIGFIVGKIAASLWAPFFPKYVLLLPSDSILGFFAVMAICILASFLAIQAALKVDPAEAIGG